MKRNSSGKKKVRKPVEMLHERSRETSMSLALGSVPKSTILNLKSTILKLKATKLSAPPIGWVFGRKHPHCLGPPGTLPQSKRHVCFSLWGPLQGPSVEHFYRFPYLFLSRVIPFHFSIMFWDSQTLKARETHIQECERNLLCISLCLRFVSPKTKK